MNILPKLIALLHHNNKIQFNVLWALGNMIIDNDTISS